MTQPNGCQPQSKSLELPHLRVRRKPWNLARIAGKFLDAIAEIEAQREPWAQHWDEHNNRALEASGPLWVVLGDSVGQGIGASSPSRGFVPKILGRLTDTTGQPWRVVNLAMTGARISHVLKQQLPAMNAAGLEPAITTCMIGFNDFIGRTKVDTIERGARQLVDQVPNRTLFARVGGPRFAKRSDALGQVLDAGAASGKITLFHPYRWTDATDVMARDRIHLNDKGYTFLADTIFDAITTQGVARPTGDQTAPERDVAE